MGRLANLAGGKLGISLPIRLGSTGGFGLLVSLDGILCLSLLVGAGSSGKVGLLLNSAGGRLDFGLLAQTGGIGAVGILVNLGIEFGSSMLARSSETGVLVKLAGG